MDAFRCYAFVSDTALFLTTNHGHVNLVQLSKGSDDISASISWIHLGTFADIRGYAVVASVPEANVAFFAGSTGRVYAYDGL